MRNYQKLYLGSIHKTETSSGNCRHKTLSQCEKLFSVSPTVVAVVQLLSHVRLFVTPWTAAHQTSLSSTVPRSCSNSCPLSWWCHPTISFSGILFSFCLQSFPSSGSFPMSWLLYHMAKVLELQLQHQFFQWIFRVDFLYDWLLCSPCHPRDSLESSPAPQFESINSSVLSLLYGPTLTCIHDCWKNHRFDNMDFYWQNDVPSFLIHDLS